MEIPLKVDGQRIRDVGCDKLIANKSQKFVKFKFDLSSEWKPLKVFAQFSQGHSSYNQYLDSDNCAFLPAEIKSGICYMMLYGTGGENVIGTTNRVVLTVTESGFVGDANSTEISQSLYDQLVEEVRGFAGDVNSKADRVYVDTELNKKADKTAVTDSLALKADKTYVDDELNKKQDKGDYALKSELIEVDPTLTQTGKAADAKITGDLIKTKAPAIREIVQGEVVNIQDSSENPFFNLAVCGKTTQNGVPTPDAPIPLETIGADGSIICKVCAGNLLTNDVENWTGSGGSSISFDKDNLKIISSYTSQTETYTHHKYKVYGNFNNVPVFIYFKNVKKSKPEYKERIYLKFLKNGVAVRNYSYDSGGVLAEYIPNVDTDEMEIVVYFSVGTKTTKGDYMIYEKPYVGFVNTEFLPFSNQLITLPTPNGLNGIKVDSDGNYTDSTGQQWICDSIEKTEQGWAVVKRLHSEKMTSAKFHSFGKYGSNGFAQIVFNADENCAITAFYNKGLCSHFKYVRVYQKEEEYFYNELLFNRFYTNRFNSEEEAKAFFANNDVRTVGVLETPIITPITNPELTTQLDLLHTYYGVTTITATDNAGLKADYSADTKIYIDNKFIELQNAILSTGGNV